MVGIGKDEMRKKTGEITQLRKTIYQTLSESKTELSFEALAEILERCRTDAADGEMTGLISEIKSGLADGVKSFEDMYKTYVENGETLNPQALLREKTDEIFAGLSEELQRVVLYNIPDCLCFDEKEKDEAFMYYTANMSLNELKDKACGMLGDKYRKETDEDILNAIKGAQPETAKFKEYEEFDGKNRDLIDAAAAFAVMRKSGSIDARKFAEQFAFRKKALMSMAEAESIDILKRIADILYIEAAAFALHCAIFAQMQFGTTMFLVYSAFFTFVFPKMFIDAIDNVIVQTCAFADEMNKQPAGKPYIEKYFRDDCNNAAESLRKSRRKMIENAKAL